MRILSHHRVGLGFLLCILLFAQLNIRLSPNLFAQEPTTNQGNTLYLPAVSRGGVTPAQSQSRQFVWRLSFDSGSPKVSKTGLSDFGREWIQRKLTDCNAPPSTDVFNIEQQQQCRMLKYTFDGKFTDTEKELIKANGGILLAIAETVLRVQPENVNATTPASVENVVHPDTGDVLYVSTEKYWWNPNVFHKAYGGVPGQGYNYQQIRLRTISVRGDNTFRYNQDFLFYNTDYVEKAWYLGWCCYGGGYALTEAWFKSYAGNEVFAGGAWLNL